MLHYKIVSTRKQLCEFEKNIKQTTQLLHIPTMPEIWHIWASSWQNPRATLSWTLREKLMQAQWLTVPPFTIFCFI